LCGCPQDHESNTYNNTTNNNTNTIHSPTPTFIQPPEGTRVGETAPNFSLENLSGQLISLEEYRGKPVLINFWYIECGWCDLEMPFIKAIYEQYIGILEIILINPYNSKSNIQSYISENNLEMGSLLDANRSVSGEYVSIGYPTSYLIDINGVIQEVKIGAYTSLSQLENSVKKILE
jgi:peroxiredoxin